jgi:MFS family permease
MPFVQYSTVLPGFLRHFDVPKALIGLAPALYNGIQAIIQPLSAYMIRSGPRRLGQMRRAYITGACGYVLLGVAVLAGLPSSAAALLAALIAVVGFAVATGIGDPHYMALVIAAVSPEQRGRYFGLRTVCLGLGGVGGGVLVATLLRTAAAPENFGRCFLAGGLLYIVSTFSALLYRDRAASTKEPRDGFRTYVVDSILPRVRDRGFRSYLIAVVFFSLAAGGFPFLSLLLRDRLGETDRLFGLLGSLFMGCNLGMSWLLGVVCDRWGPRRGFGLTLLTYAAGVLLCLTCHDRTLLLIGYFLASVWMPGQMIPVTDLAMRLAATAPAAEVYAVMMAAMAPGRILGPVLVGAAIDQWSYAPALLGCVGCAVCAGVALRSRR